MSSITLTLPWPSSDLSPNHRGAWQTKEAARKQAIKDGGNSVLEASAAGYYELPDRLQMWVTFHPPRNGRMDLDNHFSRLKPTIDGIFSVLGRDDSDITRVVLERGKPLKGGQVTIILGEMTA
jgi:crossover junction endodeoxyribonuclease RusA